MIRHITRLGLILIVIVIVMIIAINRLTDAPPKKTMNLSTHSFNIQPKEKIPSKYKEVDLYLETEKTDTYMIQTISPKTNSQTVNNAIETWLEAQKQSFLSSITEDSDKQASLKIDVDIETESKHYDRFVFQIYQEKIVGGETRQEIVFNVDLEADKLLSLNDFLAVNDQTLQTILKRALDLVEIDEDITIHDNIRQNVLTSRDTWEWFMDQAGLTFIFDGNVITEQNHAPIHVNIPMQALYLHIDDNINQYIQLSETQIAEKEKAIQEEKERILAAKREKEKQEQQKAEAQKKQQKSSVKADDKYVALTFDDGPSGQVTPRVLEILKQYDAKATFFMLGSQVDYYPEVAKQVADAGHEIGNHTEAHRDLTKLGPDGIRQEIGSTSDKINNATGVRPYLVRPPYGAYNQNVINDAAHNGNSIILWSIDSLDWQSRNADAINREIQQTITPGSIVLMHDIHSTTADALPELMETLVQEGYQFVTVSQLREIQGLNGVGPIYGRTK